MASTRRTVEKQQASAGILSFFYFVLAAKMSKVPSDFLKESIQKILNYSKVENPRKFVETVELQIGLKGYDTQRDKVIFPVFLFHYTCSFRVISVSRVL